MPSDDNARVRRAAAEALGNVGNECPVEFVVESLTDDATVVEELSETDDPPVVVPLVEILEESQQRGEKRPSRSRRSIR